MKGDIQVHIIGPIVQINLADFVRLLKAAGGKVVKGNIPSASKRGEL